MRRDPAGADQGRTWKGVGDHQRRSKAGVGEVGPGARPLGRWGFGQGGMVGPGWPGQWKNG